MELHIVSERKTDESGKSGFTSARFRFAVFVAAYKQFSVPFDRSEIDQGVKVSFSPNTNEPVDVVQIWPLQTALTDTTFRTIWLLVD